MTTIIHLIKSFTKLVIASVSEAIQGRPQSTGLPRRLTAPRNDEGGHVL